MHPPKKGTLPKPGIAENLTFLRTRFGGALTVAAYRVWVAADASTHSSSRWSGLVFTVNPRAIPSRGERPRSFTSLPAPMFLAAIGR